MHLLSYVIEVRTDKSAPIHSTLFLVVSRGNEANFFPLPSKRDLFWKTTITKETCLTVTMKLLIAKKVKLWQGNGAFFFFDQKQDWALCHLCAGYIVVVVFMNHSQSSKYTHHHNTLQQVSKGWARCFSVGFEEYWCHPTSHEVSMRPWHFVDQGLCAASSGKQLTYGRKQRVYIKRTQVFPYPVNSVYDRLIPSLLLLFVCFLQSAAYFLSVTLAPTSPFLTPRFVVLCLTVLQHCIFRQICKR